MLSVLAGMAGWGGGDVAGEERTWEDVGDRGEGGGGLCVFFGSWKVRDSMI